ncbi:protein kinase domain-containing protein [Actinacidiphila sp. bgisy167]|uniref:protein kinase domain-containing protein n=1 Tax=Actinacidiphila sp. bgisy167 TaxID=3413797 RepID=UPI003D71E353
MTGAHEDVGRVVTGRYRLLRRLGVGGMGRVWLAYDQELACEVAVKEIVLPPDLPEHEVSSRIARARGEARHAARLRNHPHVVTVHDILEEDGLPWIVMEFVPGAMDLEAVVRERGPLPPAEIARIGLAVLDALLEGHRLGILHRDVKPANILLTRPGGRPSRPTEGGGRVMLTDYGIALEPSSDEARLTATLEILGTPRFMAPERAGNQPPTAAGDLFSLGATLYYALEGYGPFDRDTALATLSALLFEPPTPPGRETRLTPVLVGLLAKDPADRMSGEEAARRLSAVAARPLPVSPDAPEEPPASAPSGIGPSGIDPRVSAPSASAPPTSPPPGPFPAPGPPSVSRPSVAPTTELPLPEGSSRFSGPPPGPLPPQTDEGVPRPAPRRRRHRRAGVVAGAVLAALALVVAGVYLTRSPSPGPGHVAPTSVESIKVGDSPHGVAVSPDGARGYVANYSSGTVSMIDTELNRTVGDPIPVGRFPKGVAVSPDGRKVYVTNNYAGSVSVIDTAEQRTVGKAVSVGSSPEGLAVSPDGSRVYVANGTSGSVSVIDTRNNRTVGEPIPVSRFPRGVAVSPDGSTVYVTSFGRNRASASVTVIDAVARRAVGDPILVGRRPEGLAVSPDGRNLYVANEGSGSVSVIDTRKQHTEGDPIPVGSGPAGLAMSLDGRHVYVADGPSGSVSVIDTAENRTVGEPISVGSRPEGLAVSPDEHRVYVADAASGAVSVITFP